MSTDAQGNLVLQTAGNQLVESAPVFYQPGVDGANVSINGQQQLTGGNQVSFQAGGYDTSKPLVIDPTLGFSSYIGGSSTDGASAIAVDANGSSYIAGNTNSYDFP